MASCVEDFESIWLPELKPLKAYGFLSGRRREFFFFFKEKEKKRKKDMQLSRLSVPRQPAL